MPDPGGLVDWGQGEFVYGRQYAVSAIIAHSENCTEFFRHKMIVYNICISLD